MKRIVAIFFAIAFCISLTACAKTFNPGKLSTNFNVSKMTYNGRTYISYRHYPFDKSKYLVDWENEDRVEIARIPDGINYILGVCQVYSGNEVENPNYIICSRGAYDLYVREDIVLDDSSILSATLSDEPFYFSVSDVTTGNVIPEEAAKQLDFEELCDFYAACVDCPGLRLLITISELDGKIYLQDAWNSDYYEITEAFKNDLYRFGIEGIEYHGLI